MRTAENLCENVCSPGVRSHSSASITAVAGTESVSARVIKPCAQRPSKQKVPGHGAQGTAHRAQGSGLRAQAQIINLSEVKHEERLIMQVSYRLISSIYGASDMFSFLSTINN